MMQATMSTALPVLRPDLKGPQAPIAPVHARRPGHLLDSHGRRIQDVRLSITDRCNFRCVYCMEPDDRFLPKMELLELDEYIRLVDILLELGIRTIRLTGGEPTLYPKLDELIEAIGQRGLDDVAMTTNGSLLELDRLELWRQSGLRRLTFSLDTLREERMASITRSRTSVADVLKAINLAKVAGYPRPKVNAVIIRGINDDEVAEFAQLARDEDLDIRFIEFMPLDSSRAWDRTHVVDADEMISSIEHRFPLKPEAEHTPHSTSMNWTFADGAPGRIGMIAPVSRPFCGACNRLRITAEGRIRPCLFSHDEWDIRSLLRDGSDDAAVAAGIIDMVWTKQAGHGIGKADFSQPARTMSSIGG
jgi:cyclic pyranopterin phosphate synthase